MKLPGDSIENRLGDYRLLRILGQGGMGTVYLGHDDALDRRVAIKILKARDDPKAAATLAKRFLREARSAARINHPHVVTIYVVGQQVDRPYIVMEYVEGGSLAEQVRREGPLEWRTAARAVRDALAGLGAAHRRGVIHRDIKPANLMRGRTHDGHELTKVVDFGLARILSGTIADSELTFPGAFVGSPSYASPEQVAGAEVDGRSDIYSMAATWFALLTGQPPFVADDPEEILERHLHETFADVRQLAPAIPGAVTKIIAKASQKKPGNRFQSAAEMHAAVEELLQLADDLPADVRIRQPHPAEPAKRSLAWQSITELEFTLAKARRLSDSTTQLTTLRSLHSLYSQLDRREEALKAFREALVIHIKLNAPGGSNSVRE